MHKKKFVNVSSVASVATRLLNDTDVVSPSCGTIGPGNTTAINPFIDDRVRLIMRRQECFFHPIQIHKHLLCWLADNWSVANFIQVATVRSQNGRTSSDQPVQQLTQLLFRSRFHSIRTYQRDADCNKQWTLFHFIINAACCMHFYSLRQTA